MLAHGNSHFKLENNMVVDLSEYLDREGFFVRVPIPLLNLNRISPKFQVNLSDDISINSGRSAYYSELRSPAPFVMVDFRGNREFECPICCETYNNVE